MTIRTITDRDSPSPHDAHDLTQATTLVVGASRGLGRGIAAGLATAGAPVIAVGRTETALTELARRTGSVRPEVADAGEDGVARSLLDRYEPNAVVLVAGATPLPRPLQEHTWETFSVNWHTDVKIAFEWVREALLKPLRPGSRVVIISSGAGLGQMGPDGTLRGSPLSGGYGGAKITQRFISAYAQEEADRAELGITFTTVLPQLTPRTDLGRPAVRAYAARSGQTEEEFTQRLGEPLTPEIAGAAITGLVAMPAMELAPGYLLTNAGLTNLADLA